MASNAALAAVLRSSTASGRRQIFLFSNPQQLAARRSLLSPWSSIAQLVPRPKEAVLCKQQFHFSPYPSFFAAALPTSSRCFSSNIETESSEAWPPSSPPPPSRFTNTTASFDWSDDEEDDEKGGKAAAEPYKVKDVDKSKLPPPYDPFNKKPVIEEPKDPKNLQEIFHKMRTGGLTDYAVKMFDGLSKDGLTHEALELFSLIKDKGTMPDVVAHTAVIETYANAGGHSKEALRTFERMLASGISPNAYTYAVLIRGLAKDGKLKEARKCILEMMEKGMRPNVATYISVFEAYVREHKEDDAKELLGEMKAKGFVSNEKAAREQLGMRGPTFRSVMGLLFGK